MNEVRQAFEELRSSRRTAVALRRTGGGLSKAIFPGAFHPLHDGHRLMALWAEARLDVAVEFEISIENVDKPPLEYADILQRVGQFDFDQVVWLTRAATFAEKSKIFPGATFIVGVDTMQRIGMANYYADDLIARDKAIQTIADNRCRFLVYGRMVEGEFVALEQISLEENLRRICDGVPEDQFRVDVSSSQIRGRGQD